MGIHRWQDQLCGKHFHVIPDNKVHVVHMGPIWVLSAPGGPHVGPMNLAIRDGFFMPSACYSSKLPQAGRWLDNIDTLAIDWANEISIPNKTPTPLANWKKHVCHTQLKRNGYGEELECCLSLKNDTLIKQNIYSFFLTNIKPLSDMVHIFS